MIARNLGRIDEDEAIGVGRFVGTINQCSERFGADSWRPKLLWPTQFEEVNMTHPYPMFPNTYRGVALTREEREVIGEFLNLMLADIPLDARQWVEHLFVADALNMYAVALVDRGRKESDAALAQRGCESAERATMVAADESIYVYRLARCLDAAGATRQALDCYRNFLDRNSENDIGAIGRSQMEGGDFNDEVAYAKERLGAILVGSTFA